MKSKVKVPCWSVFILNDDALMEILLRLPAKYLIRFKLVCKQWLLLISSDHFSRLHSSCHHKLQPSLILKTRDEYFYFNPITNGDQKLIVPYRFSIPNPNIIKSSCNGLMLLQSDPPEECVYVCNPATRQSRKISLCSSHSSKWPYVVNLVLAFDPSESPHYKVVCIRSKDPHKNRRLGPAGMHIYRIEVYESEGHTWKQGMEMEPTSCIFDKYSVGVYFNGLIYWDRDPTTWYFDIARDDLKVFYQLDCCLRTREQGIIIIHPPILQVSNGHLYRCGFMTGRCESVVVWEMQGGGPSKWLLKYNDIVSDQLPFNQASSCPTPIRFRFVEGSTCYLVYLKFWKVLRVYNFLDKSQKEILDLKHGDFTLESYEFGESLAMV